MEAETYEALTNPSYDYWENQQTVELITNLKIISAQMPLPILLAGVKKFKDPNKFLNIIIAFVVRYVTIGDRDNKVLEKLFSDIAREIREGSITTIPELKDKLSAEYVDDEIFFQLFSDVRIKTTKVSKYLLQEIENHIGTKQEKFNKTINVEHFLPKKPNEEWQKYIIQNDFDKDVFVDPLGNMTLLLGKVNQKLKNEFFPQKCANLFSGKNDTMLKINEWFKNLKSWTDKDIEERQKWLAKQAVEVWKI